MHSPSQTIFRPSSALIYSSVVASLYMPQAIGLETFSVSPLRLLPSQDATSSSTPTPRRPSPQPRSTTSASASAESSGNSCEAFLLAACRFVTSGPSAGSFRALRDSHLRAEREGQSCRAHHLGGCPGHVFIWLNFPRCVPRGCQHLGCPTVRAFALTAGLGQGCPCDGGLATLP